VVELQPATAAAAGELARRHALTGADAVHLASAGALSPAQAVVVTWDRRLHAAARATGFAVAPAAPGPEVRG
jgi:predicted nucleic acid-binding protein